MEKGLAWTSQEAPSSFLCHPSNRGGLMLSWRDCHDKGSSIVSLGADATKLSQSVAFELAINPVTKAQQVKSNQDLVEASQGKLAPLSGQERHLTVGGSKGVLCGCAADDPWLCQLVQPPPEPGCVVPPCPR